MIALNSTEIRQRMVRKERLRTELYSDYFLITLLLVMSGDPAFYLQKWSGTAFAGLAVVTFLYFQRKLSNRFILNFCLLISGFVLIFVIQYFTLGYVSIVYVLGFLTKTFLGAVIFWMLKDRFAPRFFDVMVAVCIISFPFYALQYTFGDDVLASIFLHAPSKSIGLYTFRPEAQIETSLRNSGMFWEPGAFQAYINLCLFMNFYRMPYLLKHRKMGLAVMILALISTQSTTGYIIFAILVGAYFVVYSKLNTGLLLVIMAGFLASSIYFFNKLDFLGSKITSQYDLVVDMDGDFDPSRFGALLFDLHYIRKHPITGNGFHPSTRYADHPLLILQEEAGEDLGHGNGFSGFIASAGFFGLFWYYFTLVYFRGRKARRDSLILCMVMIVLMQGEHFLIYPFFLGLPFFLFTNNTQHEGSRNSYLLQPKRLHLSFNRSAAKRR